MKTIKNLTLRKETVASLENREMQQLKGGDSGIVSWCPCQNSAAAGCTMTPYYPNPQSGGGNGNPVTLGCPVVGPSEAYTCVMPH